MGKIAVVAPIFATALAISYDVGFFTGTDIRFFTFFSLAEHVVFALQSLPIVAPVALLILSHVAISWITYRSGRKSAEAAVVAAVASGEGAQSGEYVRHSQQIALYRKLIPLCAAMVLVTGAVQIYLAQYVLGTVSAISAIYVLVAFYFDLNTRLRGNQPLALSVVGSATIVIAFAIGVDSGVTLLRSNQATETLYFSAAGTPSAPIRVVRGGDRGVLVLVVKTKRLQFIRWDVVKAIESE